MIFILIYYLPQEIIAHNCRGAIAVAVQTRNAMIMIAGRNLHWVVPKDKEKEEDDRYHSRLYMMSYCTSLDNGFVC